MANKRNYQKELDAKIAGLHGEVPTLLLHSCCAPCSSYVLEYLSQYFSITLFYYNPNIYPPTEYEHRVEEQQRLIRSLPAVHPISFCPGPYDSDRFYELTRGMENVPEGGERCFVCYEMRLREAAEMAKQLKLDYFTTTLSISPLKNAEKLNEIGERLAIVQNPFLVLLLMDSSGRSDQQNFCFSCSLFEPPFVFCFRLCYYYNKLFQGFPIQK